MEMFSRVDFTNFFILTNQSYLKAVKNFIYLLICFYYKSYSLFLVIRSIKRYQKTWLYGYSLMADSVTSLFEYTETEFLDKEYKIILTNIHNLHNLKEIILN